MSDRASGIEGYWEFLQSYFVRCKSQFLFSGQAVNFWAGTDACRRAFGQLEIDPGTVIPWTKLATCGQQALVAFARTQGAIGDRDEG